MRKRMMLGLASLAAVAIVVPSAIVVAGGSPNAISGQVNNQAVAWTTNVTAKKNWKPVPGGLAGLTNTPDELAVTVSAQMKRGTAVFRIVPVNGGAAIPPGTVRFTARAANSFTWGTVDTCGPGDGRRIEWKRVGSRRTVAAKLSVQSIYDSFCF
jgi:hypothetical protein